MSTMTADWLAGLAETILNRRLAQDPDTLAALGRLAGRSLAVEIRGTGLAFTLLPGADGFHVYPATAAPADARVSGPPLALLALARAEHKTEALFAGRVEVTGDTRLAQRLARILERATLDWEEALAGIVGDVAAHAAGERQRDLAAWWRRLEHSLHLDLGEYLQEEVGQLPARVEVAFFSAEVDALRDDGERLAARIERLERRRREGEP